MFWGYSLAFSRTANSFIGDFANFGMKNVAAAPSPGSAVLPEIVFCFYELLFAACTVQIVIGGSFERGRIIPSLVFGFCWCTIVYCPIACWSKHPCCLFYVCKDIELTVNSVEPRRLAI